MLHMLHLSVVALLGFLDVSLFLSCETTSSPSIVSYVSRLAVFAVCTHFSFWIRKAQRSNARFVAFRACQKGKELVLLRLPAFVLPRPVYQLLQGVASECSIVDDKNAEHRSGNLGISKPRLHSARLSTSVASDVLTTSGRREAAPE